MKKILLPLLASLGLGGCVAVPVSDAGYAPAPVYVAPPTVVVRPYFYGYYRGGWGGHHYH